VLTVSKGNGIYPRFLVIGYEYARRELEGVKLEDSKMLIDDEPYLLLTIRKNVEVNEHRSKLFIDIDELFLVFMVFYVVCCVFILGCCRMVFIIFS